MTTPQTLPISGASIGQILDILRSGPKTPLEIAQVVRPAFARTDPEAAGSRYCDVLAEMEETGRVRQLENGKYEAVPDGDDPEEKSQADGAESTGEPAESDNAKETEMTTMAPKKRGRPPKAKAESNGHGKPEVASAKPAAVNPTTPATKKKQGSVLAKEETGDHLEAIDRVEQELAAAKINYEDTMNVRRMKKASLDVAKSERRRFSVHEGSGLEQIKAAQKAVDKATKQYNEAAANCLEAKNKVNSVEEKLSRTIAGEMPLFGEPEGEDAGDDE